MADRASARSARRSRCRARPHVALATAATLAVVLATGCGDSGPAGPRLGRAELTARAEARCTELASSSDPVAQAQAGNLTGPAVRRAFAARAASLRGLVDGLDDLVPPAAMADDYGRLVGMLRDYGVGLDDLADAVAPGQGVRDVLGANSGLVAKLNDLATRTAEVASDLGLLGCIAAG